MIDRSLRFAVIAATFAFLAASGDAAARGISLIRDAEIEDTIRAYAEPLFTAAGLDASAVRVHLVNDRTLNAFVAGGQRLFLNTGLILATERPAQLIGVIAHETGHIAGGHLARKQEALRSLQAQSILALILGLGAAAATGKGEAAGAVIYGGTDAAARLYLKYTRTEESSADQSALRLLDATGQSAKGMLEFLEIIADQELLVGSGQDPYLLTHPLTSDRISTVRHHVVQSPLSTQPDPPALVTMHRRMQAKLHGFLDQTTATLRRYPESDTSVEARYARAAGYHRRGDLDNALAEIDSLLADDPNDPYFNELKGQILFEHGKIAESIPPYRRAVDFRPSSPLLLLGLAQPMIATGRKDLNAAAIPYLERAVTIEPELTMAWHQLAVAYGRNGELGLSALANAEEQLGSGNYRSALMQAKRALQKLSQGSPGWFRAQDIERLAAKEMKKQRGQPR